MKNRALLMKYAIDNGLAEDINTSTRFKIYQAFQKDADFDDPDFQQAIL